MKHTLFQALGLRSTIAALSVALSLVAFCIPAGANTLAMIDDPLLKDYTRNELDRGAPSLYVTSRVVYREALEILERGDWEAAREKLLISASISGDYPDPMFTLARVELLHAHPDFLFHLIEGLKRQAGSFHRQAMLAMNLVLILTASATAALLLSLLTLLCRYWKLIDHGLREAWSSRYAFPPARIVGFLVIAGLAFMRLGVAVYTGILIVFMWPLITRREKGLLTALSILIIALSFSSPVTDTLVPAVDEGSTTRRLSRINVSGAHQRLLVEIGSIDDGRFTAEKDFALGTLNFRLGRYADARDHLLASVSRRNDFAPAYLNLGNVYFMQSDFNRALAGYQNVIAIDSTDALAHFNIGQAYINKMLFAESSSALKRSSEHGIEKYRQAHPAVMLRDETVYTEGFPTGELWAMAWRESRTLESSLLDRLMRPYLLLPLNVFGFILIGSLIAGSVMTRHRRGAARAFYCDNCGSATCPDCSDDETGLHFCGDCTGVIRGLSSVKVMEALLRHRRHKVSSGRVSRLRWVSMLVPGSFFLLTGSPARGVLFILVDMMCVLTMIWSGFYFKDPAGMGYFSPLWKLIVPAVVLGLITLASARKRPPREQRNFRILPADFRIEEPEESSEERPAVAVPPTNEDKFAAFLDSL